FWNSKTLITKDNWLMQVIKVAGFSFETADDEDIDIRKTIRNTLWKGMVSGNFGLYFHIVRRKKNAYEIEEQEFDIPNIFARYLDEEWRHKHSHGNTFVNNLYVTIIRRFDNQGISGIENALKKLQQKTGQSDWATEMQDVYEDLDEMVGRVMTSLRDYNPTILSSRKSDLGNFSEILEFLGSIINCGEESRMQFPMMDINKYIATNRLFFGKKLIELRGVYGSKYAGIVSLREYGPRTNAGMMDGFLQMPFEYVISQSFKFVNKQSAISSMVIQQNRMQQSEDKAVSQMVEISEALDMAMSGHIGFGKHHLTVLCVNQNTKALESYLNLATVELSNTGGNAIREKVNLEPAFWAQLPCNYEYIVRSSSINTLNLASYATFHNFPTGQQFNNHWGDAVTVFETTSGTPFYFNFHIRDVGHTTIIGPTGAGKTVMMNFLCAQSLRFSPRIFFFDKDRGAEIFLRAVGGVYTVLDPGGNCGFNPLLLPDTTENRGFLNEWLKILLTCNGEIITSEDQDLIIQAINGNYKLDIKDRKLSNIVAFLGIGGPGSLANRINMWHTNGAYAGVFDNDDDSLDFKECNIFGFEMADLLREENCLGPVLLYLFHKINLSLDGSPTIIVLDEAWALIDNQVFAPKIKDWLKVLRKLNCFVIFATQSVEDAANSAISDTLIQQTATQIFLPNLKANASGYMDSFMLSQREFTLIKTTDPSSRFFLVKQGLDAVIAKIDLSDMDNAINILSGRAETVILLDNIREEYGDDPDDWLPVFCEKVKNI
ncbi:MAG: VirB4 family type IV secretion/conjugal transfer ATPase, partial [Pseudomonadota bacterium]